jgi:nucleoside-diphosphate-sugar epimerase/2-polyprenyl-3-methyl-5-hydroxy-6-metoxy-1,4-benzoquinol methylase
MKIAIIGACGYIGSLIYTDLIKEQNIDLVCYDIQDLDIFPVHIKKKASEISIEEINTFDIVLYLAGISRKIDCEKEDFTKVCEVNVNEIEEFIKKATNKQLIIYASTGSLYSEKEGPSKENDSIDPANLENYELSMYQREIIINKMKKRTIALRFGTVVGVGSNIRSEIIYNGLYYSAFSFNSIKVWNSKARRSILYYKDLYNIFSLLIQHKDEFITSEIFNVGSFNSTIGEIAESISKKTGATLSINDNTFNVRIGFQMDTAKICERLNYKMIGNNDVLYNYYVKNKENLLELINNPVNKTYKCILCNSILMKHILNLGNQPLANDFLDAKQAIEMYPLHLFRCRNCYHTQINYLVDRNVLFKNYIYESGTSTTLRNYFKELAVLYNKKIEKNTTKKVLEIACNDGFQLDEFKTLGWETYGVDPAENLVKIAQKKGHIIDCKFWGKEKISFLEDNVFDLILAENVLAHVTNPINFLQCCEKIMNDETLLVIQTSQANMYRNNEFDTIYHEHISFFTIKSMCNLVRNIGCSVINIYKPSIHGTSYVFEIKKGVYNVSLPLLQEEEDIGLYSSNLYFTYEKAIQKIKITCLNTLKEYKDKQFKILGFGAAAKGNVFLNYIFDSSSNKLCPEYIIDDSSAKQGKYTSGTLIPITSSDILHTYNNSKLFVIILAWNFSDEIILKINKKITNENLKIICKSICFFPELKVCDIT